tara:strand:- start:19 stop:321 length:303 start_codon:yes stop_codon:yes gene_type:complete
MTILEISLVCSVAVLLILLVISISYNIKHGLFILKILKSIEQTLDVLDERYDSISKVLDIPLFYDSPQIRGVVEDIRYCRDSLLESANLLTNIQEDQDDL